MTCNSAMKYFLLLLILRGILQLNGPSLRNMRKRNKFLSSTLHSSIYNHHESKALTLQAEDVDPQLFHLTTSTQNSNIISEHGLNSSTGAVSGFRFGVPGKHADLSNNSENNLRTTFFKSGENLRDLLGQRDVNGLPSLKLLRESHEKKRCSQEKKPRPRIKSPISLSLVHFKDLRLNDTLQGKCPEDQNEMRSAEKFLTHLENLDPNIGLKPRKVPQLRQSLVNLLEATEEPKTSHKFEATLLSENKPGLIVQEDKKDKYRKILSVSIPRRTNADLPDVPGLNKKKSLSPTTPLSSFKRSVVKKLDIRKINNEFLGKYRPCTPSSRRERFQQNPLILTNELCQSMNQLTKYKDGKWLYHFMEKEIKIIENFDKEKYGKPEEIRVPSKSPSKSSPLKNTKSHSNGIKNMIIDLLEKKVKPLDPISLLYQMRNKRSPSNILEVKGKTPTFRGRAPSTFGVVNPVKLRKLIQLSKKLEECTVENENENLERLKDSILRQRKIILDTEIEMLNKYKKKQEWNLVEEMRKKYDHDLKNKINPYESDLRHRLKKCENTYGELKFVSDRNKMNLVNMDYMVNDLKRLQAE